MKHLIPALLFILSSLSAMDVKACGASLDGDIFMQDAPPYRPEIIRDVQKAVIMRADYIESKILSRVEIPHKRKSHYDYDTANSIQLLSQDGIVSIGDRQYRLKDHTQVAKSFAYSPDGTHIALGLTDSTISIYNTVTEELEYELNGHTTGWVTSLAYSPDGKDLISTTKCPHRFRDQDQFIRVWDTITGMQKARLYPEANSLVYSPDGSKIASASNEGSIRIWNATTYKLLHQIRIAHDFAKDLTFSPNSRELILTSCDYIKIYDMTIFNAVQKWLSDGCPAMPFIYFSDSGEQKKIVASPIELFALIQKLLDLESLPVPSQSIFARITNLFTQNKKGVPLSRQEIVLWACLPQEIQKLLIHIVAKNNNTPITYGTALLSDDNAAEELYDDKRDEQ